MKKAVSCVYILFRPWNGSPFYVGKGVKSRVFDHAKEAARGIHCNQRVQYIFNKAKRLGLEVPGIVIREGLSEDEAFEIERALIAAIGRKEVGGPLANLTDGGEGGSGLVFSKKSRLRVSEVLYARWRDPAARLVMSNSLKGRIILEEHRQKLKAANKKRFEDPTEFVKSKERALKRFKDPNERLKASKAAFKRFEDPAQRLKTSQAQRKRYEDPIERQKSGDRVRGKPQSDEHRKNSSAAVRKAQANPIVRQRMSDSQRKRYEDPAERLKASEAARKRHAA